VVVVLGGGGFDENTNERTSHISLALSMLFSFLTKEEEENNEEEEECLGSTYIYVYMRRRKSSYVNFVTRARTNRRNNAKTTGVSIALPTRKRVRAVVG